MPTLERYTDEIDWAGIRAASVVVGVREAARQASTHLSTEEQTRFVERVMKRCSREGWIVKADAVRNSVRTMQQAIPLSANVRNGAETLQCVLAEDARETRISLSKSTRRLAKDAEKALLEQAGDVLQVTKAASLIHGWAPGAPTPGQAMVVNISVLSSSPDPLPVTLDLAPSDPMDDY